MGPVDRVHITPQHIKHLERYNQSQFEQDTLNMNTQSFKRSHCVVDRASAYSASKLGFDLRSIQMFFLLLVGKKEPEVKEGILLHYHAG